MSLRRLIDGTSPVAGLLLLLAVAGCGGSGAVRQADQPERRAGGAEPAEARSAMPGIPPEAQTLFEQATAVMAAGDFVDAELRFEEFVLQYPDYPGAYVNLAIIHANNENDGQTRAALDSALALDPGHPAALNQLGMLLRRNGHFLEAEAAYLKAVTVSPDYALAHYNLGVLNELYLQRLEAALHHFEIYQGLVGEDKQVEKWITDLRRRVAANRRTANVAE
ncbi:MAG: tetratricopeptide repeat protein [Proteobacteria bacterium]|nr:tetratricopeptide repeat protein [Pseudomonadota bacterium]